MCVCVCVLFLLFMCVVCLFVVRLCDAIVFGVRYECLHFVTDVSVMFGCMVYLLSVSSMFVLSLFCEVLWNVYIQYVWCYCQVFVSVLGSCILCLCGLNVFLLCV